jgi:hypothetical protein
MFASVRGCRRLPHGPALMMVAFCTRRQRLDADKRPQVPWGPDLSGEAAPRLRCRRANPRRHLGQIGFQTTGQRCGRQAVCRIHRLITIVYWRFTLVNSEFSPTGGPLLSQALLKADKSH